MSVTPDARLLLGTAALFALSGCVPPPPPAPGMLEGDAGPPAPTWVDLGPGGDACERTPLTVAPQTPQIILMLDRSGSMGASRWEPARQAVVDLTESMDASWEVGLELFPSAASDDECGVLGLDVFPVAPHAETIAAVLSDATPHGATPTTAALEFAGAAFAALRARESAMSMPRPQTIVLVTDGASNCDPYGNLNDSIIATTETVRQLRSEGITTYVIGYDIGGQSVAARAMDDWASEGGTGVALHVRDGETLLAELRNAVASTAPCAFAIDAMPSDPALLRIRLDGRVLRRDTDYAWMPGMGIQLSAERCLAVRDGESHPLAAELLCVPDFG
ncbi:MAG: VWA domain-containing protein [Myxococcales bacterium]|nr:VWA domain-containing protein [Myxococcales bacterium]MCB9628773.1 VWA domain-containing protein [Sandaracinaceae bacterium]